MHAALASQKNYLTLHLMGVYQNPARLQQFQEAFAKAGKNLNMGKACIRFRKLNDLPLKVIRDIIVRTSAEDYIPAYEASRQPPGGRQAKRKDRPSDFDKS